MKNLEELNLEYPDWVSRLDRYFDLAQLALIEQFPGIDDPDPFDGFSGHVTPEYFSRLPNDCLAEAAFLTSSLIAMCGVIVDLMNWSVLISDADKNDLSLHVKEIRASIRIKKFSYIPIDVLHDEGRVLGVAPAQQRETTSLPPATARLNALRAAGKIQDIINLLAAGGVIPNVDAVEIDRVSHTKVRSNTAFIMMAIDDTKPELSDVVDVVKDVFASYGITAVRADQIEHDGLITQRVLEEIRTSEFLFADLTGERPNVYYEIGYAHALDKRVILFRKQKTGLHFDLAGYNCPAYENLRDLRQKLTLRLAQVTNRKQS